MAKEATKPVAAQEAIETNDIESLWDANGANLTAVMKASEAVWRGMAAISNEMMAFANTRLRHNLEISESMMRCHDASEMFGTQVDYARTATQQYLEEANKLFAISTEMTKDSWAPLEDRTREALGEQRTR